MRRIKLYDEFGEIRIHEIPDPWEPETKDKIDDPPEPEITAPEPPIDEDAIELYSLQAFDDFKDLLKSRDSDSRKRLESVLARMSANGNRRRLAQLPDNWAQQLDELESGFPNFTKVIDSLRDQWALSMLDAAEFNLLPSLLVGPPGVGKTEFLNKVASIAGVNTVFIDLATAQTESCISGSDSYWSNSKEGAVFESLAYGEHINPMVVLDEIDKASDRYGYSPFNALYGLLEPASSKRFADRALPEIPIDASRVVWLATANTVDGIAEAILSRFTVFNIPSPDASQVRAIACNIYSDLISKHGWGKNFTPEAPADVIETLSGRTPRQIRKALLSGFGGAARDGRQTLSVQDVLSRLPDTAMLSKGIGFI